MSVTEQAGALARAIHAVLAADTAVGGVLGDPPRLYDAAPEDPIFPYLTYGAMRSADIGADATPLASHQITLHFWSRYAGRAEVLSGLQTLSRALSQTAVDAAGPLAVISAASLYSDILRAPDGRTQHGLLRMSFSTQGDTL